MAALNRPKTATYECHQSVTVDTQDNEDHTFCGIMFPVKAKEVLPVERVVIHSIAVRGQLGDMTVWVSNNSVTANDDRQYAFRLNPRHWTKIYDRKHSPSQRVYQALDLTHNPVILKPGQVRMLYIHSSLHGDEAIVYDNSDSHMPRGGGHGSAYIPRYQDDTIAIYTGKAHLATRPFHQLPIWGWGNAWRDRREFVGQLQYGVVFKLWNPYSNLLFGTKFQAAVRMLLLLQRHPDAPFARLPDECLYYILNICRWDWFDDDGIDLKQHARRYKQRLHQQPQQQSHSKETLCLENDEDMADATESLMNHDEYEVNVDGGGSDDGEDDDDDFYDEEDDDDDNDQDDDDDDDDDEDDNEDEETAWERANGYLADNSAFNFHDISSDDDESEMVEDATNQTALYWMRSQFNRTRVARLFGNGNHQTMAIDDDDSDIEL